MRKRIENCTNIICVDKIPDILFFRATRVKLSKKIFYLQIFYNFVRNKSWGGSASSPKRLARLPNIYLSERYQIYELKMEVLELAIMARYF